MKDAEAPDCGSSSTDTDVSELPECLKQEDSFLQTLRDSNKPCKAGKRVEVRTGKENKQVKRGKRGRKKGKYASKRNTTCRKGVINNKPRIPLSKYRPVLGVNYAGGPSIWGELWMPWDLESASVVPFRYGWFEWEPCKPYRVQQGSADKSGVPEKNKKTCSVDAFLKDDDDSSSDQDAEMVDA